MMLWLILIIIGLPLLCFAGLVIWLILSPDVNDSPFHPFIKGYPTSKREAFKRKKDHHE